MKKNIIHLCLAAVVLSLFLVVFERIDTTKSHNTGGKEKITQIAKNTTKKKDNEHSENVLLLKVGQRKNNSARGKITLERITTPMSAIKDGPLEIAINTISIYKIQPQNNNQKQRENDTYQTSKATNFYYTIHIDYNVKNTSNSSMQLKGLKSISTNTGQHIDVNSGLLYGGSALKVDPNSTRGSSAEGLIKKGDEKKINKVTLKFGEVIDSDSSTTLGGAEPMDFELK